MKRFTETTKWLDPWFQDLPTKFKLLWLYIVDNCSAAGVWKVNLKLASFQIGEQFDSKESLMAFNGRVEDIGGDKWWVIKFCDFQYGSLSDSCKPHQAPLKELARLGLIARVSKAIPKGSQTLQEKEKDKDKDKDKGGSVKGGINPENNHDPNKSRQEIKPRLEYAKEKLTAAFHRQPTDPWDYLEESTLSQIVKDRPRAMQELMAILDYRETADKPPRSILSLLQGWTKYLDQTRNQTTQEGENRPKSRELTDAEIVAEAMG